MENNQKTYLLSFVETPRKFIIAELSIRKLGSSSVLIIRLWIHTSLFIEVAKHSWTNDHRIKWNEASILATESHKFSRKMRESIEIEKHSTIDQEGKPLDSTWRALFTMQN